MSEKKRVAVLGGGPIGIEAALFAARRGYDVQVFERGRVGENVRSWGHVTLFSAWELNRSPWGEDLLREQGVELAASDVFPTGADYVEHYLSPLAGHELLAGRVNEQTEVLGVSRAHALKGDFIANAERGAAPFLVMTQDSSGAEHYVEADVVIDVTGSYSLPNALGPGGLPALGERAHEDRIERYIPDTGAEREVYAGKRTLLIGAGYSAVTSAKILAELIEQDASTQLFWLMRSEAAPYELIEGDPLPQRVELGEFGNSAAAGHIEGVKPVLGAYVKSISTREDGALDVAIWQGGKERVLVVDRIVSNVGYHPDNDLSRELQVHLCYASEGPMKLAASLLSAGGGGDCLAQTSAGAQTLLNPEPGFFVLGAKSYGRNSSFLLKLGVEQIGEVFSLIDDDTSA